MTNREELLALAERCEAAEGADRELDCHIWAAIEDRGASFEMLFAVVSDFCQWQAANYTLSLDAAMGLVPEKHMMTVANWWNGDDGRDPFFADCMPFIGDEFGDVQQAWAKSHALALCAAALRARAAMCE